MDDAEFEALRQKVRNLEARLDMLAGFISRYEWADPDLGARPNETLLERVEALERRDSSV